MPIKLVHKIQGSVGSVDTTTDDATTDADGSHSTPAAVSGSIGADLSGSTVNFDGSYQDDPSRTGTIGAAVAAIDSQIFSSAQSGGDTDLSGTGIFVDSINGSDSNDGSSDGQALQSLPTGLSASTNVYLKADSDFDISGSWDIDWGGVQGNRVLITAYYMDGPTPKYVYEGSGANQQALPRIHGYGSGFQITSSQDYIAVEYVDLTGNNPAPSSDTAAALQFQGDNCIFRDSIIGNSGNGNVGASYNCVQMLNAQAFRIQRITGSDHGEYDRGTGSNQPDWGDFIEVTGTAYGLIEYCDLSRAGHSIVNLESAGTVGTRVRYNTFDQNFFSGTGNHILESRVSGIGRHVIEQNVLVNAYASIDEGDPQGVKLYGAQNIFRFNDLRNINGRAIQVQPNGSSFNDNYESAVYNNDIDNFGLFGDTSDDEVLKISDIGETGISGYGWLLYNNYIGSWSGSGAIYRIQMSGNEESGADGWNFNENKGNAYAQASPQVQSDEHGTITLSAAESSYPSLFASNTTSASKSSSGGVALASATNSGANSTALQVDHPYCFSDGHNGLVTGDTINVGGATATITAINYSTGALTLDTAISWSSSDPVSLDSMMSGTDVAQGVPSGISVGDITPPAAPTGVTLLNQTANSIQIDWAASAYSASYTVYKSITSDTAGFSQLATVDHPTTIYTDSTFDESTRTWYKVTATDAAGNESLDSTVQQVNSAAQSDWEARTTSSGVVWYHDFRTDAEVDNFRWLNGYGNDQGDTQKPGRCVRDTTLSITGGASLRIDRPAAPNDESPFWWRPFGPMDGTANGRGSDDPGDGVSLKSWNPADPDANAEFLENYYAPEDVWGDSGHAASKFEGDEFWIQRRLYLPASYFTRMTTQGAGGKLDMILTTQSTLNQEIVNEGDPGQNPSVGPNYQWSQYTNFGASPPTTGSMKTYNSLQGGGKFGLDSNTWWVWPEGIWVTQLTRIVVGHDDTADQTIQVWIAPYGETTYTKLYDNRGDRNEINFSSPTTHPQGYNAISLTTYSNNNSADNAWSQYYDQVIFSHRYIECPDDLGQAAPTWATSLATNMWTTTADTNTFEDVQAANVGQYGNSGPDAVFDAWNGAAYVKHFGNKGSVLHWGGGHQDYYGNEVYSFDLETLTWTRLNEPSTANGGSWNGPFTDGLLSDDTPNAAHTFFFIESDGDELFIGRRQVTNSPALAYEASRFYPETLEWKNSTVGAVGVNPGNGDGMVFDTKRRGFWFIEGDVLGWAFWDPDAETFDSYTQPTGAYNPGSGAVYIPTIDAVLLLVQGGAYPVLDCANPSADKTLITVGGSEPSNWSTNRYWMARWSENLGKVVVYESETSNIFTLTPPAGDWKTDTWTWDQISHTGSIGNVPSGSAGTFGKFTLHEWGDLTVGLVIHDVSGAHSAIKLNG